MNPISLDKVLLLTITLLLLMACEPSSTSKIDNTSQESAAATPVMAAGEAGVEPPADVAPLLDNLGDHHHPITTSSSLVQRYFDQGLTLTFAFNHAEAIRSFKDAAKLDPDCAMCYWGIALALGPNINAPMEAGAVPEAYEAVQKALALASKASQAEQAYIQALAQRYGPTPVADRGALDQAYADAMRELSRRYPDDLDGAVLFAEALMNLTPWEYWTPEGQPTIYTKEILATLESVLERNPNHIGANHYYIHSVEASPEPERALPSAERLGQLAPGAGHLVHMPAHIYWRVGRYHKAVVANEHAIHTDEQYIPDRGAQGLYRLGYYPHNIHFLFAAAQMEGNGQLALEAARKLVASVPEETYPTFPQLEEFRPMPLYALVRFGKWAEILREPKPAAPLQYTGGMWHWARGMAFTKLGQLDSAAQEYEQLIEIGQTPAMAQLVFWSASSGSTLLEIAAHILAGELAGVRGQTGEMIAQFKEAVGIQDNLRYIEPPAWYYPVRHHLGAALLEAGRAAEAEAVYREDLKQYPHNGWSLFGLAQSLREQGQTEAAAAVQKRFEDAWQYADVALTASRF
ncbi:Tetratricopeptide TPR_4 [Nitrosococcus halophilus Nc 4]|uniref:Tetratricopeptide TPR_4 n=1 Tax=Nitrosococcus halophilus (strain Nc4) TaxID=472759 RepID=D5C1R0_NITHN|nr:tetratricopeptide repeat protein [Nitrosococcus halophilus]ADE14693.1 Tetratricopeptide TPR_4 [Nitrosococcus halophilus Nc 4]